MRKERSRELLLDIKDVILKNESFNNEVRIAVLTILGSVYYEELKYLPEFRDQIRERFEKEIDTVRRHTFGDR